MFDFKVNEPKSLSPPRFDTTNSLACLCAFVPSRGIPGNLAHRVFASSKPRIGSPKARPEASSMILGEHLNRRADTSLRGMNDRQVIPDSRQMNNTQSSETRSTQSNRPLLSSLSSLNPQREARHCLTAQLGLTNNSSERHPPPPTHPHLKRQTTPFPRKRSPSTPSSAKFQRQRQRKKRLPGRPSPGGVADPLRNLVLSPGQADP